MMGDTERIIAKTVSEIVSTYPAVEAAVLFGSRALGRQKKGSDVDIALKGHVDFSTLSAISYALNEKTNLPYFFDVLAYEKIDNPALKEHIDRYGIELTASV
jgi:predicted nucleotidyltransferase